MTTPDVTDAMREFRAALTYRARRTFPVDRRTRAALAVCVERGDDVAQLAARCSKGLGRRSDRDIRGLLLMRLFTAAGIDYLEEMPD